MSRRWPLLLAGALALLVLTTLGGALTWAWRTLTTPYQGYPGLERTVVVEPGQGGAEILATLEEEGILADARITRLYLVHGLDDPAIKAGEYRFSGPLSALEVLEQLLAGRVATHPVTVVEGLTLEETASLLARSGFGGEAELRAAMGDPRPIADLDPRAPDLEGYLFPDTYFFARGTPPGVLVGTMVENFRRRFEGSVRPLLGEAAGTLDGVRDVVTLASIVEKEARLEEERPLIAAVYHNRLARKMGLYADPTVIYALKRLDRWDGNLRRPDLRLDHPYNTYVHQGLPPGPICSPGEASLRAAASPAEVPFLYFVSRNDGSHVFARTLREHNRNVERWQRRYWQERWARERIEQDSSSPGSEGSPP